MRCRYFGTKFGAMLFDNHTVSRSVSFCYFGVMFDQHNYLSWKTHIDCLCSKIARGIALLKLSCKFMPILCLMYTYNVFIMPYLNYLIELWGNVSELYLSRLRTLQKCNFKLVNDAP